MHQEKPVRGVCMFAYNNEQIDYIKLAVLASAHVKKHLGLPVCLITDSGTDNWMSQSLDQSTIDRSFDFIVLDDVQFRQNHRVHHDSPWTEFKAQFNNSNKHNIFQYTPFDQTILIDTDYIVKSDFLSHVFTESFTGVSMFDRATSLMNEPPALQETWLYDAGCRMWWSTVVCFDKSELSRLFFDTWAHVSDNYDYYRQLYSFPGQLFRTDYCVSIATHILNGMQDGDAIGNFNKSHMYYADQKDDIYSIDTDQNWIMLANDRKTSWKNILVKHSHLDVHVMNKRALLRHYDSIMEKL
jgi:dipeptidyl aminopeptidase/acylaminoacyl peptidase